MQKAAAPWRYQEPAGVPFVAVDGDGILAGDEARLVERVDGHVDEQDMVHFIPEAAEVGSQEEGGRNRGELAQSRRLHHVAVPDDRIHVAPVLDDRVGTVVFGRGRHHALRLRHRRRQRLFAQDMAAQFQGGQGHGRMGRGHGAVEDDPGAGVLDHVCLVGAHGHVAEGELLSPGLGQFRHEVDHAHDFDVGTALQGPQPRAADATAAHEHGAPLGLVLCHF